MLSLLAPARTTEEAGWLRISCWNLTISPIRVAVSSPFGAQTAYSNSISKREMTLR